MRQRIAPSALKRRPLTGCSSRQDNARERVSLARGGRALRRFSSTNVSAISTAKHDTIFDSEWPSPALARTQGGTP